MGDSIEPEAIPKAIELYQAAIEYYSAIGSP